MRFVSSIISKLHPDMNQHELRKFSFLSAALFCSVGAYWLLRLLKNTVLYKIAFPVELGWPEGYGRLLAPTAKLLSPIVVIAIVLIYSKLVDSVKKHRLFYIVCSFYASIFAIISLTLGLRTLFGNAFLGKFILATTGWVSYFATESCGSVLMAMFWAYTASICTTDEAKRGYSVILTFAQLGAIGGSSLTFTSAKIGGVWGLYAIAACIVMLVPLIIKYFVSTTPKEELVGNPLAAKTDIKEGPIASFISGLKLLFTRPYLFGILIISTLYEVVGSIIDYIMNSQLDISPIFRGEAGFLRFQGIYGVSANTLAFLIALLGTRYLIKRLGTRRCLLIYPIALGLTVIILLSLTLISGGNPAVVLWTAFGAMLIAKGLSYAVNGPTKEIMYIPTSRDAKFKTKAWIDMFGGRMAKMSGAQIAAPFKHSVTKLTTYGSLAGLGIVLIWLGAAIFVGKKNEELVKEGKIVE